MCLDFKIPAFFVGLCFVFSVSLSCDLPKGIIAWVDYLESKDWINSQWASLLAQWWKICLQCIRHRRHRFDPWVRKIPWRRAWQPTPVYLPGESCGLRRLMGYSPWGYEESDMTEATEHAQTHLIKCWHRIVLLRLTGDSAPILDPLLAHVGDHLSIS